MKIAYILILLSACKPSYEERRDKILVKFCMKMVQCLEGESASYEGCVKGGQKPQQGTDQEKEMELERARVFGEMATCKDFQQLFNQYAGQK